MMFDFFNCNKTTVKIKGKVKSTQFFSCKKMKIEISEQIAESMMLKSEDMKFYAMKSVPHLVLENCKTV